MELFLIKNDIPCKDVQEKIEEMKYLTQSYLVGIQKILRKLFLV